MHRATLVPLRSVQASPNSTGWPFQFSRCGVVFKAGRDRRTVGDGGRQHRFSVAASLTSYVSASRTANIESSIGRGRSCASTRTSPPLGRARECPRRSSTPTDSSGPAHATNVRSGCSITSVVQPLSWRASQTTRRRRSGSVMVSAALMGKPTTPTPPPAQYEWDRCCKPMSLEAPSSVCGSLPTSWGAVESHHSAAP